MAGRRAAPQAGAPDPGDEVALTVLGCDGSWPGPGGAGSAYLVRVGGTMLLLDCGPGTFAVLQTLLDPGEVDAVVVSHHHADHWTDLYAMDTQARFAGRRSPLPVYAPAEVIARAEPERTPMLDWRCVTDGDRAGIGEASCAFHRTDHVEETLAVRVDGASGPWATLPTRAPTGRRRCSATVSTCWCARRPTPPSTKGPPEHLSGRQAGAAARGAGAKRLVITHRWPTVAAEAVAEEATLAFGGPVEQAAIGKELHTVNGANMTKRADGRGIDELRTASFERDFTVFAPGSVLVSMGRTRVLCTASIEERVPPWMRGSGKGWVTAEYSLLPGSTGERVTREAAKGKQSGRTQEIQRLIGRSLRSVCDMVALGEVQVTVDCDVLQADGGTRTASICGAYVALHDALTRLVQKGTLRANPLTEAVAAVSVGVVDGVCMLDLPYEEDSRAEVDMNVVMTSSGRFIEVQGTAEGMPFTKAELDEMLSLAEHGIAQLLDLQTATLAEPPTPR